jgi:hypothetical protein
LELYKDAGNFAVEVLAELPQSPLKRRLHLLAFALANFSEPVVLQVGQKRQEQNEDHDD